MSRDDLGRKLDVLQASFGEHGVPRAVEDLPPDSWDKLPGLASEELEYVDTSLRVIMSVHAGLNCLTLLSCAGVLARNFLVVSAQEVGFDADAVFYADLTPNPANPDRPAALRRALDPDQRA